MKTVKKALFILLGAVIALVFLLFGSFLQFDRQYKQSVYPGVAIDNTYIGGMSKAELRALYDSINEPLSETRISFEAEEHVATFSGVDLHLHYDADLAIDQAMIVGRSQSQFSNTLFKIQSFASTLPLTPNEAPLVFLNSSLSYDSQQIVDRIDQFATLVYVSPIEPQFEFNDEINRVTTFALGANGKQIDVDKTEELVLDTLLENLGSQNHVVIPVDTIDPKTSLDGTTDLGIVELIAEGNSFYKGSIPGRIHNVVLASSRVSGVLVAPGEIFSFNDVIGDISAATGYKSAYIIKNGRTVLGDGGGVCQVSTTVFRAALNAGLEIVERTPHSYRVAYYEQGGYKPGLDATVYSPSVDLKIRNNTENHILIQSEIDQTNYHLTYKIYGKSDGRSVEVGDVQVLGTSAAPPPLYQEDPTLATGEIKQVDWAAGGANTLFDYKVIKSGEILDDKTFVSNFRPWKAVYLYGPGTTIPEQQ